MNNMSPTSLPLPSAPPGRGPHAFIPPAIAVLLGPPPVCHGESRDDFEQSFRCLAEAMKPRDALDWLIIKDIADANWEAQRMQRYIAALVKEGVPSAARRTLGQAVARVGNRLQIRGEITPEERDIELRATLARLNFPKDSREFRKTLKSFGFTEADLAAHAYADHLSIIAKLEANKARCDDKKARLLRDYERRQIVHGRQGARGAGDITDLPANAVT